MASLKERKVVMSNYKTHEKNIDLNKDYDVLEPVPMEARTYNKLSMFLFWFGANAKPGNWYVGGLIGAFGFAGAMYIMVIGAGLSYLFNVAVGLIGFTTGIATFALTRTIFGINGSRIFSVMNALTFLGWAFINGITAAIALNVIFEATLGFSNMYVCGFIMAVVQGIAVIFGREAIRKLGVIGSVVLIVASIVICVMVASQLNMEQLMAPMSDKSKAMTGTMLSMIMGSSLGWVPAAADFGRYAKDKATAGWISYASLLVTSIFFCMTGAIGFIATGSYDPANMLLGMGLGWPFLIVIMLLTVTTNVVNLYTGAMSLQNAFREWLNPRKAILIMAVVQIPFTTCYQLLDYSTSVFNFMSIVFGPVFTILIVDYYVIRKRVIDIPQMSVKGGIYWYYKGFNLIYIAIDIIGIILYFLLGKISFLASTVGAMIPMMIIVGILTYICGKYQLKSSKIILRGKEGNN